jgi:hypothetical protein
VIGIWCVGLSLFTVKLGRAAGHMLWVTFAVGGLLGWSIRRSQGPRYMTWKNVSAESLNAEAHFEEVEAATETYLPTR